MKKAVILGCENSHADSFLDLISNRSEFSDTEIIGVYSDEIDACLKLKEKYGVGIMDSYDEAVGYTDGVIITARHGGKHLKYALPYIESSVPMFIDKPITVSESDALELAKRLKAANVKVTGGSSLRLDPIIEQLRADVTDTVDGRTLGGLVRAPLASDSAYGGFFFYAQHLCEMVMEIFGRYPSSVKAYKAADQTTVIFRYGNYDVTGVFVEHGYSCYYASRFSENRITGSQIDLANSPCFYKEFKEFHELLNGGEPKTTYKDFIAPVFVMNAILRSLESGSEEKVNEIENI
ncbi:MAG: Gfo/Idh/MocA family oxidoreductase [Clostridia bacterium]|nr:Gfo/Idh/MocA family oxidoreductase [Clostridia bacterium]